MGKALIVYYSLEGNTKLVAETVKKELEAKGTEADLLELKAVKAYPTGKVSKYFWGGRSSVMAETPDLEMFVADMSQYDTVILGTPIWAASVAPPLRTFLRDYKLVGKKVAGFVCCAGGATEKALTQMKELSGVDELVATMKLVDPASGRDKDWEEKTRKFVGEVCEKGQDQ